MNPGYGKTCRKDVLRGVEVPVVPGAAGRARPVPRLEGQAFEEVPARRAGLAARVPAVGLGVGGALALGGVAGMAGGEGPVPHDADAAERARQRLLLRLGGVRPAPVRRPHPYRIQAVHVNISGTECRSGFLPDLKTGASTGDHGERGSTP